MISDGTRYEFSLTAALRELTALDRGTEVRLVFRGWTRTDTGRKYKEFELYTRSSTPSADTGVSEMEPTSEIL